MSNTVLVNELHELYLDEKEVLKSESEVITENDLTETFWRTLKFLIDNGRSVS